MKRTKKKKKLPSKKTIIYERISYSSPPWLQRSRNSFRVSHSRDPNIIAAAAPQSIPKCISSFCICSLLYWSYDLFRTFYDHFIQFWSLQSLKNLMMDFDSLLQFSSWSFFVRHHTQFRGRCLSKEQEMNLSPQIFLSFVRELKIQIILQRLGSPFFDFPFE